MNWLIIGNPENRRVTLFQKALAESGQQPANVLAYSQLVSDRGEFELDAFRLALERKPVVRIESSGENFEVEKKLLKAGASILPVRDESTSNKSLNALSDEHGRIRFPHLWYSGYQHLLSELNRICKESGKGQFINCPNEIALMFDKPYCNQLFHNHHVSTPRSFTGIENYDQLVATLRNANIRRAFIKLAYGSSASGIAAIEIARDRQRLISTAELVRNGNELKVFNSLNLKTYRRLKDIRDLINWICCQGAHVEEWIQKSRFGGQQFDVRIVAIGNDLNYAVVRSSNSPITNLHLGNQRGDLAATRKFLGNHWQEALETCARTKRLFPDSLYCGIDVCFRKDLSKHYILEVNAFGDLLPGIQHLGKNVYVAEIEACLRRANAHRPNPT